MYLLSDHVFQTTYNTNDFLTMKMRVGVVLAVIQSTTVYILKDYRLREVETDFLHQSVL